MVKQIGYVRERQANSIRPMAALVVHTACDQTSTLVYIATLDMVQHL